METLHTHEETFGLGKALANALEAGDILLLEGDLGAGKTTLTPGLAEGLGVEDYVNSPTFVLINEYYGGRLNLYHMDLYRVEEEEQLYDLGLEEYLFGNGVCVIEWPDIAMSFLPDNYATLHLNHKGTMRQVTLETHGNVNHIKEAFDEYFSL